MVDTREGESLAPSSRELALHARAFERVFGGGTDFRLFFSPGRVNLMGAHLDYNGGPVMPTAINRGTFIAVREHADRRVRLASTLDSNRFEFDLSASSHTPTRTWVDYPLGVALEMLRKARESGRESRLAGLEILFGGNLPVGAGLSSSASICVGTAVALQALWELDVARMDLVHVALRAERGFVGVQCGIMDPYAVGLARAGHLLWLDCKDASSAYIPLHTERVSVAVADSHVRRELAQGAFNERVRQCAEAFERLRSGKPEATCLRDVDLETFQRHRSGLDPLIARRAEHVIREVARTFAARDALLRDDAIGFGVEMTRAHASLRDLFEVSVPELDQLVQSAVACDGVLGSRLTGAGFGGCTVILMVRGAEAEVRSRVQAEFERHFGRKPSLGFFQGDGGPRELTHDWRRDD
jgi:galactokinase